MVRSLGMRTLRLPRTKLGCQAPPLSNSEAAALRPAGSLHETGRESRARRSAHQRAAGAAGVLSIAPADAAAGSALFVPVPIPSSMRSIMYEKKGFDDVRMSESMLTIRLPRSPLVDR